MTQGTVFALAAQKWANLVESCCPAVTRTEWHASPAEIAITAWLTPRDGELGDRSPEVVEIVASCETVDDYIYAPELAQLRADTKPVEFVRDHEDDGRRDTTAWRRCARRRGRAPNVSGLLHVREKIPP